MPYAVAKPRFASQILFAQGLLSAALIARAAHGQEAPASEPASAPSAAPSVDAAPPQDAPPSADAVPAEDTEPLELYEAVAEVEAPAREPTRRTLKGPALTSMPGTRGDPIRAVEVLPGVARAPFGSNPILRGAASHESMTFLDGVQIPELYHFGGLTSVVHPALVDEVNLYPSNFSAKYGRASGGIIEVKLRSPRRDGLHGMLEVSLLDSSALVEGPVASELAVAAAVRRSNIDFVFENFVPEGTFSVVAAPLYWDYQLLSEYTPSSDEALTLTLTGSRDSLKLVFDEPNQYDANLRGEVSGALEHHTLTLGYRERRGPLRSSYQLSIGSDAVEQHVGPFDGLFDAARLAGRAEWDTALSDAVSLTAGLDVTTMILRGSYRGQAAPAQEGTLGEPAGSAGVVVIEPVTVVQASPAAYVESRLAVTSRWQLNPGLRLDFYEDLDALTINPRFNQRYALSSATTLKSGVGGFSQRPVWHESLETIGNPALQPYHALHTSLGVEHRFAPELSVDVDGFYKYLYERVVATEGGAEPHFINHGQGRIVGVEASAEYANDGAFGQLSYTLSRSERQDRNEAWRLFDYDQTHVLNLAAGTDLPAGFALSARFRYVTGNPLTPVVGAVYDASGDAYQPRYGAQNSERETAFHQLDVRLDKRFAIGSGALTAYLELLNAYNAGNTEGVSYSYDYSRQESVPGTPFFPNIGLRGEL